MTEKAPNKLYRYMGSEGVIATLETKELRFSHISLFDDKKEFTYKYVRPSMEMLNKKIGDSEFKENVGAVSIALLKSTTSKQKRSILRVARRECSLNLRKELKERYRICCFTIKNDLRNFWNDFAKNKEEEERSGAALEFEFISKTCIHKVLYFKELPRYNDLMPYDNGIHFMKIMCHKGLRYAIEHEYRYILPLDSRLDPNAKSPEDKFMHISFEPDELSNVYLGDNMLPEVKKKIISLLMQDHYAHVGIYELSDWETMKFECIREPHSPMTQY